MIIRLFGSKSPESVKLQTGVGSRHTLVFPADLSHAACVSQPKLFDPLVKIIVVLCQVITLLMLYLM